MAHSNACHQVLGGDVRQVAIGPTQISQRSVTTVTISSASHQGTDSNNVLALGIAYDTVEKARSGMDMNVDRPSRTMPTLQSAGFSVTGALRVNSVSQLDTLIRSMHRENERPGEEEEWEKSFVGSSSDISFQRPQQMDAMIDQYGKSLPSASSLLHMLLEKQEKDAICGDNDQGKDSSSTEDDMQLYFLLDED
jgi:hypothetical protein